MENFKNIKNIIFDLGGVVLNINPQLSVDAFADILGADNKEFVRKYNEFNLLYRLEKGEISPEQFRNTLKKIILTHVSDEQIDTAWNSMLLDFPKERIDLLSELRQKYRTFLLSNTNKIHYNSYTQKLNEEFGIKSLSDLFEEEYMSFNLNMRKPDKKIFHHVLDKNNLLANETLFIDDTLENIESAKQIGINAYLLKEEETINDVLK
ncbi:MAG: HAD family phosphatase [Bacteroidales bacterium]|nr:HAD family phosphatase [Bacteroidales bacterium]